MAQGTLTIDRIWSEFRSLSPTVQGEFIERLVAVDALRAKLEDSLDLALVAEREHEPTRSFEEVAAEIEAL